MQNHRNQTFNLANAPISSAQKLVVYLADDTLPTICSAVKHHVSRTSGVIHVMAAEDYLGVLRALITPAELAEYLRFREALLVKWPDAGPLPEQALVGQFLSGDLEARPNLVFADYLRRLEQNAEEWDLSTVITKFMDRVTGDFSGIDYHKIVKELAKLTRTDLRAFKTRFKLCMDKARANEWVLPYRITVPQTGCGFLFVPLTKEMLPHRQQALQNLTLAHKYDQRLEKCVGASFAAEDGDWFAVEWCYVEFPWHYDTETDALLKRDNPFREVKAVTVSRYTFKSE